MNRQNLIDILDAQSQRCALTGRELAPESATVDHIQPLGRGGMHDVSNAWVVCTEANVAKGALTVDQFVSLCREVVAHVDSDAYPPNRPEQSYEPMPLFEP